MSAILVGAARVKPILTFYRRELTHPRKKRRKKKKIYRLDVISADQYWRPALPVCRAGEAHNETSGNTWRLIPGQRGEEGEAGEALEGGGEWKRKKREEETTVRRERGKERSERESRAWGRKKEEKRMGSKRKRDVGERVWKEGEGRGVRGNQTEEGEEGGGKQGEAWEEGEEGRGSRGERGRGRGGSRGWEVIFTVAEGDWWANIGGARWLDKRRTGEATQVVLRSGGRGEGGGGRKRGS